MTTGDDPARRTGAGTAGAGPGPQASGALGDRIRGAFAGLAIGDAVGWPAGRHRFALLAPWTRRLGRELDLFAEEHRVTTLPVPFALNQPVAPLAMGPSDDAEWLAWTALGIATDRAEAFAALAGRDDIRARISVRTALDNLARGLGPPHSGHDNPHFFDDAAAVRAVAFGAARPGRPEAAADDARADAEVTNSGDGVSAARAMAAAVAAAVAGAGPAEALAAGTAQLPPGSAIGAVVGEALAELGRAAPGQPFDLLPALEAVCCDHVYSYGTAAQATLAAAFALTGAAQGALGPAVSAAACLAPLADSAPALTGALAGALGGYSAVAPAWRARAAPLAGCCLPELAGTDLIGVADALAASARSDNDDRGAGARRDP
ncbi:ADP-ribosylglycohydrolase family protein [Streptomonospora nanhaiensis]|uniref:ADP-ribosylglycohydrolase family protein n=2 Tax=Streptomonospora nanhaiensis TaxID=1323731 RepID=UPI001C394CEB|nr:ADP-ribosylglycohydrolase family protein [Streptomonospora nanhaiensis]MBV2361945.1 ADP-ribosylglycohydrolase family protein [Streptomonospora nanhaiensis]